MKVTLVLGSPTKNGNTCVLAREVLRGVKDFGAEIEEIFLAEYHIEYCMGCVGKTSKLCMATGKCNINDDADELRQKLYNSDGIILATPSYGIMPSAIMKNFLVDRIGMFTTYTSSLGGKYFVGISTCGGVGAKKVAKDIVNHFTVGFHQRGYASGYLGIAVGYDRIESNPEAMKRAYKLGVKLAKDIVRQRKYPFQRWKDRLITSLIVRKIILKNIYANRDGNMKAVYENLVERGLIKPLQ